MDERRASQNLPHRSAGVKRVSQANNEIESLLQVMQKEISALLSWHVRRMCYVGSKARLDAAELAREVSEASLALRRSIYKHALRGDAHAQLDSFYHALDSDNPKDAMKEMNLDLLALHAQRIQASWKGSKNRELALEMHEHDLENRLNQQRRASQMILGLPKAKAKAGGPPLSKQATERGLAAAAKYQERMAKIRAGRNSLLIPEEDTGMETSFSVAHAKKEWGHLQQALGVANLDDPKSFGKAKSNRFPEISKGKALPPSKKMHDLLDAMDDEDESVDDEREKQLAEELKAAWSSTDAACALKRQAEYQRKMIRKGLPQRVGVRGCMDPDAKKEERAVTRMTRNRRINSAAMKQHKHDIETQRAREVSLNQGVDSMEGFKKLILVKHHNYARAWRLMLDVECYGCLTQGTFAKVCRKLGLQGFNLGIWKALNDGDDASLDSVLTLRELDENTSDTLQCFYTKLRNTFPNMTSAFKLLAAPKVRLKEDEFCKACALHHLANKQDASALFHYLALSDTPNYAAVCSHDFQWLDSLFHEHVHSFPETYAQKQKGKKTLLGNLAEKTNDKVLEVSERMFSQYQITKEKNFNTLLEKIALEEKLRVSLGGIRSSVLPYSDEYYQKHHDEHQARKDRRQDRTDEYYAALMSPAKEVSAEEVAEVTDRLCSPKSIEFTEHLKEAGPLTHRGPAESPRHTQLYEDAFKRRERKAQAEAEHIELMSKLEERTCVAFERIQSPKEREKMKAIQKDFKAKAAARMSLAPNGDKALHDRLFLDNKLKQEKMKKRQTLFLAREIEGLQYGEKRSRYEVSRIVDRLHYDQEKHQQKVKALVDATAEERNLIDSLLSVHRFAKGDKDIFVKLYKEAPKRYWYAYQPEEEQQKEPDPSMMLTEGDWSAWVLGEDGVWYDGSAQDQTYQDPYAGWWQASDGQWYPPEGGASQVAEPDNEPAPAPAPDTSAADETEEVQVAPAAPAKAASAARSKRLAGGRK